MQEYKYFLEKIGHEVDIFNYKDVNKLLEKINNNNYDFIHLHAYQFVSEFNKRLEKKYCFTCHHGYFLKEDKWEKDFQEGFQDYLNAPEIIALSHATKDIFLNAGYSGYMSGRILILVRSSKTIFRLLTILLTLTISRRSINNFAKTG